MKYRQSEREGVHKDRHNTAQKRGHTILKAEMKDQVLKQHGQLYGAEPWTEVPFCEISAITRLTMEEK